MLYIKSNNIYCFMKKANAFRLPTSPPTRQQTTDNYCSLVGVPADQYGFDAALCSAHQPTTPQIKNPSPPFALWLVSSPTSNLSSVIELHPLAKFSDPPHFFVCSLVGVRANQRPLFSVCVAVTGEVSLLSPLKPVPPTKPRHAAGFLCGSLLSGWCPRQPATSLFCLCCSCR